MMNDANVMLESAVQKAAYFRNNIASYVLDDVDYDWALAQAQSSFAMMESIHHKLDDKANEIIKLIGGATAIVTVGALINVNSNNWYIALTMLPALFSSVIAMYHAIYCRKPCETAYPPNPKQAFECANHFLGKTQLAKGAFIARLEEACAIQQCSNESKAEQIETSATWMIRAVALLLVPFLVAVCKPPPAPNPVIQSKPSATSPAS